MSSTLKIQNQEYLPAGEAGKTFGYTSDYIARLAREGKIAAERIGKQWFVHPASLESFVKESENRKQRRGEKIRTERLRERVIFEKKKTEQHLFSPFPKEPLVLDLPRHRAEAFAVAILLVCSGLSLGALSLTHVNEQARVETIAVMGELWHERVPELLNGSAAFAHAATALDRGFFAQAAVTFYQFVRGFTNDVATVSGVAPNDVHVPSSSNGLVILPGDASMREVETVRNSFSDDVRVTPDPEGGTGLIQPIFRERDGDHYRYVLVPLQHESP